MKRFIILVVLLLIVGSTSIGIALYYSSTRVASFVLADGEYTVTVSEFVDNETKKVAEIDSSKKVRLSEGSYGYSVNGKDLDNSMKTFTVKSEGITVNVVPEYSNDYLAKILATEQGSIEALLRNQYSNVPITINVVKLYEKGDWAAGTLSLIVDPRELPDNYRYVLKKDTAGWKIIVPPTIAINKSQYKDVPLAILYDLYN